MPQYQNSPTLSTGLDTYVIPVIYVYTVDRQVDRSMGT